jgi:hypothetical protein
MNDHGQCGHCPECDHFIRLPGLFRRWEIEQVVDDGDEFHISAAGKTKDGADLFAIYSRERPPAPLVEGGSR